MVKVEPDQVRGVSLFGAFEFMSGHLMNTYGRLPVTFAKGEGIWLVDTRGKKYLDAFAGVAVCGLGHAHPEVTQALCDQAGKLTHTSNWYGITNQETLADRLSGLSGMETVFFSNSGAEANEAAIKMARLFGRTKDIDIPMIIVTEHAFHGRTLATLTASGSRKVQAGFEPLVHGFIRVPYDDLDAIKQVAKSRTDVVAVMIEPVMGEAGVVIPDNGYLKGIREICDTNNWLMIADEIQTGLCRTGKWFACQHENVTPDIMTLAKALGNGFPIGACMGRGEAAKLMQPGNHGSTFGGSPLACGVGLSVLDVYEKENLHDRAHELGQRILAKLKNDLSGQEGIEEIRGKGLMIAIELDRPCLPILQQALDKGLLINVTAGNIVRLLPPLILTNDEADEIVSRLVPLIKDFLKS